jgi:hypothetical protein
MQKIIGILLLVLALPMVSFGQKQKKAKVIRLENPSLEGLIGNSRVPEDWCDCGFVGESSPDTQPFNYGVKERAIDGNTYLGLVVRDNNTWERIGQKLRRKLVQNVVYSFSFFAYVSEKYESQSRKTGQAANYNKPVIIRIWGGNGFCQKDELLVETKAIDNYSNWKQIEVQFTPKRTHPFITIEAYYDVSVEYPYNGNVLIDNLSDIVPVNN